MPKPHPPPRLHVIFAREAHKAVILRHGPSRRTRLSLWHTDTDVIEHGQWLHGRVYEDRCDLSPDGSMFIYFAEQYHRARHNPNGYTGTFIAISRPPYFTALTLWNESGVGSLGGKFVDDRTVAISWSWEDAHPNHPAPAWLKCVGYNVIRDAPSAQKAIYNGGWIADPPWIAALPRKVRDETWNYDVVMNAHKPSPDGRYVLERQQADEYGDFATNYALVDTSNSTRTEIAHNEITGKVAQMDWDQRGRLICASEGKLWVRDPDEPNADGTLIEDFNGQTFEPIPPPDWAQSW